MAFVFVFSCSTEEEDTTPPPSVVATPEPEPPAPTQYTLTVTAEEGGAVSTEGGTYDEGTEITITATPEEGYEFIGWEGSDSMEASLTVTLGVNTTLNALFETVVQYTLTVSVDKPGLVSISGGRTYDNNGPDLTSINPNDYSIENNEVLIGKYERRPNENGYHDVEIFSDNGQLKWKNAAGFIWSLEFIDGDLWSGSDGVYEQSKLGVYIDDNGNVLSLVFNNENYDRVSDTTVTKAQSGTLLTVRFNSANCTDFVGWEGINFNEETFDFNIDSDTNIELIYSSSGDYNLNVGTPGNGVVYNVTGELTLGKHMYNTEYTEYTNRCFSEGEDIFLWAKPDDEYQFYGWRLPDGRTYDMNGGRIFTDTELKSFYNTYGDDAIHLTPIFVEHHFWEDPLYSSLNMDSTPEDIVRVFLEESSQYGWNFKDKVEEIIINTSPPEGFNSQFGWGAGSMAACIENTFIEINIPIHDGPDSFTRWDFSQKMTVIYHELGHDLMNLSHICLPAHHMSGWDSCDGSTQGVVGDISPMIYNGIVRFGGADLLMKTNEEVLSFKRATKDLFELNGQDVWCDIE